MYAKTLFHRASCHRSATSSNAARGRRGFFYVDPVEAAPQLNVAMTMESVADDVLSGDFAGQEPAPRQLHKLATKNINCSG